MNTNDLPPAAKLAALIEAGRAANPDLKHGRGELLTPLGEACALGFAGLGMGLPRELLGDAFCGDAYDAIAAHIGVPALVSAVWRWNDGIRETEKTVERVSPPSLDDIIRSLREGELAKVSA